LGAGGSAGGGGDFGVEPEYAAEPDEAVGDSAAGLRLATYC